jgi:thiamine kinase-like enzyme
MTIEALTRAFEHEQQIGGAPVTAEDLPISYEAITDEWLTNVLCTDHPGAEVIAHRLDVIDDGNSNRRRIYLDYNDKGTSAGLPDRVFGKATHALSTRMSVGLSGGAAAEVHFFNNIRPHLRIEAPTAHFATINPSTLNSIILLRHLPDDTTFCTHTTEFTRQRAENQMRLLASFHGQYLDSPELATALAPLNTWKGFFGTLDYPAFEDACDQGFAIAEPVIPDRLFARRREIWPATRQSVTGNDAMPATLTHGDCHQRNWYITPTGEMGLNDWQAATRGHWSRDVAYTLATALTIDNRRAWEHDLLDYYFEHLERAAGRTLPCDGMFDAYRQQLMTVLAFWTITINPAPGMPDMQPRDSTLEYLNRISTAIDDLDTLDSLT